MAHRRTHQPRAKEGDFLRWVHRLLFAGTPVPGWDVGLEILKPLLHPCGFHAGLFSPIILDGSTPVKADPSIDCFGGLRYELTQFR
jgi:hypothetical protein